MQALSEYSLNPYLNVQDGLIPVCMINGAVHKQAVGFCYKNVVGNSLIVDVLQSSWLVCVKSWN